jgi:signal peptidase I
MEPNLHQGQYLVINKLAYRFGNPRRGDVIVFQHPYSRQRSLIKRVVGLPGEHLEIVRGQVWINGRAVEEPYVYEPAYYSFSGQVIEPEHIFVLGDNRNNSSDSRRWGTLRVRSIIGKAVLCYWPPHRWGWVGHGQPVEKAGSPRSQQIVVGAR